MSYLSDKNGYRVKPDTIVCKVIFTSGVISLHLFDSLERAKKYSELVTKKFSCVASCELALFSEACYVR